MTSRPIHAAPPWFKLLQRHPAEAIREVASWWYQRDMQPFTSNTAKDPARILRWFDELAFSHQNHFKTDATTDTSDSQYVPVYIENQYNWTFATDDDQSIWLKDEIVTPAVWCRQSVNLLQFLLQATMYEAVMGASHVKCAVNLSLLDAEPFLSRGAELPLPTWTSVVTRFVVGNGALMLLQQNGDHFDLWLGSQTEAAMDTLCNELDTSQFEF
jgi:hypothetical protein